MKFRFVGTHADTVFKVGKDGEDKHVPVGPGDFVELTDKDKELENNKGLFSDGLLMEVKDK